MLDHEPDTLQNFAMDAFSDYIIMAVQNWLNTGGLDIEWIKCFSQKVHEMLGNVLLPSHVANEVTMRLLRQVDEWIDRKRVQRGDNAFSLAMANLTSALVHPAVTHLDFLETETFYVYRSVDKLVSQDVAKMNMLRVLRLQRLPYCFENFSFPNLQELILLRKSTDKLIELLSVTCTNLKKLDMGDSHNVTNGAVQFLVKFKLLENLNIMGATISDKGFTKLLVDLSSNRDSEGVSLLKSLGCNVLIDEQLHILVNNFHNLMMLEMADFLCTEVSLLRRLKYLQRLTIQSKTKLEMILEAIGHQLSHLKLFLADAIELGFISKHCPSLVYLNLNGFVKDLSQMTPLISFKSLEIVDLSFVYSTNIMTYILTHCKNVRVLKINCEDIDSNAVVSAILQNNPPVNLEELHLWVHPQPLMPDVGRQIVSQCKNLRVMYGNVWWSRIRSRKPWYSKNGVRIGLFCVRRVYPKLI